MINCHRIYGFTFSELTVLTQVQATTDPLLCPSNKLKEEQFFFTFYTL